jgi:hypothetical protein
MFWGKKSRENQAKELSSVVARQSAAIGDIFLGILDGAPPTRRPSTEEWAFELYCFSSTYVALVIFKEGRLARAEAEQLADDVAADWISSFVRHLEVSEAELVKRYQARFPEYTEEIGHMFARPSNPASMLATSVIYANCVGLPLGHPEIPTIEIVGAWPRILSAIMAATKDAKRILA